MGILALLLGALTLFSVVQLWHFYLFALLFGCAAAFDAPVRQTLVAEMEGDTDFPNAVALNSTLYNGIRIVEPAIASVIIASVGYPAGLFYSTAPLSWRCWCPYRSCVSPICRRMRVRVLPEGSLMEGFHYVASRPDLKVIQVMLFLIGTFGLNFPIFISTMAVNVFYTDARGFSLLSSIMAIGTLSVALLAVGGGAPRQTALLASAAVFGLGCLLAAIAPDY